jgi:hypothetical protein
MKRYKLETSIIIFTNNIISKGLFKTIQAILFGNQKNVCPIVFRW